jgi:dTDP-4-dehydrorhamnose reductase
MRVTLFGSSGLLGQEIVRELRDDKFVDTDVLVWGRASRPPKPSEARQQPLPKSDDQPSDDQPTDNHLTALSSKDADLRYHARVRALIHDSRPDWIILSAAYTDVDGCESNRDQAFAVNCDAAVNIAQAARDSGSRLMFLSTDYVFDGSKRSPYETGDPRNPAGVYGESKARAEERLLEILPDVCIARTSWLFGHGGKCFPATILKLASTRPEISVVNDQRGSPTFTHDLASALVQLCRASANGIVHVTNSGDCTWYDFASEIVRESGLPATVKPVTTAEFPRPARRPAYSVLSPDSLHAYNIHTPDWQDALRRYLRSAPLTAAIVP